MGASVPLWATSHQVTQGSSSARRALSLLCSLDNHRHPLRTLFGTVGYLIIHRDELEHALDTLFQKSFIHVLSSTGKEKINLYSVTIGKPITRLLRFEHQVMVASTEFDLYGLHFCRVRFLGVLDLLV